MYTCCMVLWSISGLCFGTNNMYSKSFIHLLLRGMGYKWRNVEWPWPHVGDVEQHGGQTAAIQGDPIGTLPASMDTWPTQ